MRWAKRLMLAALLVDGMSYAAYAGGFDFDGEWATDAAVCSKIFVRNNNGVSISRDSDLYGSGFIVDGDKIRGKMAACTIKARKEDEKTLNMVAVCSSDIALSTVQFMLRIEDNDKVTRMYPGIPELGVSYVRCPP